MLRCIMSNNKTDLKSMTSNSIPSNNKNNISTNTTNNNNQLIVGNKRLNSISTTQPQLNSKHGCEILADQNSNSNSDESSETSSADSSGDQRMDAAESLLSIANTPTTEFKAFGPTSNTNSVSPILTSKQIGNNLETCFSRSEQQKTQMETNNTISLEDLANDLCSDSSGNEWTSEAEKEKLQSAVQLILERASRKLGAGGSMPTSITIKTSSLSNAAPSKTSESSPVSQQKQITAKGNDQNLNITQTKPDTPISQAPSLNLLIESFSASSQQQQPKVSPIQQQICSTPVLVSPSSSSFMFLSTGQAKKQKKFRLDADEFKPALQSPIHNNIIPQSENVQCTKNNVIKNESLDPIVTSYKLTTNSSRMPSDSDNNSDDDIHSIYSKKPRTNSSTSSVTNLNESLTSLYTVRPAPTLATGRKSKDVTLPPAESAKRQERRNRNKEAAARCRRKREEQTYTLSKKTDALSQHGECLKRKGQELLAERNRLEKILISHEKVCQHRMNTSSIKSNCSQQQKQEVMNQINQSFQSQQQQQQLIRIKKEEIDDIKKISSEKIQQKLITPPNGNQNHFQSQASNSRTQHNNHHSTKTNSHNTTNNMYLNFSSAAASYEKSLQSSPNNGQLSTSSSRPKHNQHQQPQHQQPQHQQQQSQLNHELFHHMLQQSSKLLTPQSGNSLTNNFDISHFTSPEANNKSPNVNNSSNQGNSQLKRPGNLNLSKQTSPSVSNNNSELAKKIKEQNTNTAALYQFFNSASNGSFMGANSGTSSSSSSLNGAPGRAYNPNRPGILLTPTFQLNTPILNYGHLSFALTPLIGDYSITPSVLQQHLVNTPIEKFSDQNNQGGL